MFTSADECPIEQYLALLNMIVLRTIVNHAEGHILPSDRLGIFYILRMSSSNYRGIQKHTSNDLSNSTYTMAANVSYAQVTQQATFPKKEQAIILDAIHGISIKRYIVAIGNLIRPTVKTSASYPESLTVECIFIAVNKK